MNAESLGLMAVVVQTGALFFWGGRVHQMLKEHERRLKEGGDTFDSHDRRLRYLERGKS